jgi:hypothetical protein
MEEIEGKPTAFYSTDFGMVLQRKITSTLKSKFKVKPKKNHIRDGDREESLRCIEFEQKYLDRIKSYYDMPDKIIVISASAFSFVLCGLFSFKNIS